MQLFLNKWKLSMKHYYVRPVMVSSLIKMDCFNNPSGLRVALQTIPEKLLCKHLKVGSSVFLSHLSWSIGFVKL